MTVTHDKASVLSVAMYWGARCTLKQIYRVWPLTTWGIRTLALVNVVLGWLPTPSGISLTPHPLGGVPGERSTPMRAPADGAIDDAAVLYLHGGAFLFCGPATHRSVCRTLAVTLGVPVYSVDYRQLPNFGVGTAVADAYRAYGALREELGPEARIVVAGDSAGGFLAAKVCELAALDHVVGPAAVVGYSPLIDLDFDLEAAADAAMWSTADGYQPASTVRRAQRLWDHGPTPLRGARAMQTVPEQAATKLAFPPVFLTTAESELLEPPVLTFAAALAEHGVVVETHRWRRGVHAFPVLDNLTPESRDALARSAAFVRRALNVEY